MNVVMLANMKIYLLLFLVLSACTNSPTPQPASLPYSDGLSTNTLRVAGTSRTYLVYKPVGLTNPKAVVLVLHGGGGLGAVGISQGMQHPLSVFKNVADTAQFLVVFPEGQMDAQGAPVWNDCRSDNVVGTNADDVSFLDSVISKLTQETGLSSRKVFVAGGSNGALMTYRYAFSRPSTIRAIATSSGNLPAKPYSGVCSSGGTMPVPALMTHGTADPQMPPNGGCVANIGGNCNRGTVVSLDSTINYVLRLNGLVGRPPTVTMFDNKCEFKVEK